MSSDYDVAIVGGGPAGAVCAGICARAGLKTKVIERCVFPREKVCGDCINPGCWRVIDSLGLRDAVLGLPHSVNRRIRYSYGDRASVEYHVDGGRGKCGIAVKRSAFDELLLGEAERAGAQVEQGVAVTHSERDGERWHVGYDGGGVTARWLVAADGRNSAVCRMNSVHPKSPRNRVALQTYANLTRDMVECIGLKFLDRGYCGYTDVGDAVLNLCIVGKPADIPALKSWAGENFELPPNPVWKTISPIERQTANSQVPGLLLVGDAGRVVEPFTGEGIRYAMESGLLAGRALAAGGGFAEVARNYRGNWRQIYRNRLWVNKLARFAVKNRVLARAAIVYSCNYPAMLGRLTQKVCGNPVHCLAA